MEFGVDALVWLVILIGSAVPFIVICLVRLVVFARDHVTIESHTTDDSKGF